jgi:hypothetical protein
MPAFALLGADVMRAVPGIAATGRNDGQHVYARLASHRPYPGYKQIGTQRFLSIAMATYPPRGGGGLRQLIRPGIPQNRVPQNVRV